MLASRIVALALAIVAAIAAPARADTPLPADVAAWLAKGDPYSADGTIGDLTGTGTQDWAGLVELTPAGDEHRYRLVVVFLQQPDGHYRLAAKTVAQPTDCGTSVCGVDGLDIQRHSVFIHWTMDWHGCHDQVSFQFKRMGQHWPLIGVVSGSTEMPYGVDENDDPRQGPTLVIGIDHNRLTGDAIVTQRKGRQAPRVTRLKLLLPPVDLDGFGDFGVPENKAFPALCGRG